MPKTPPPKPEDYIVVDGSDGPRRDFRISVGLREGWDPEGRVFDVSEAVRTARAWMRRRVEAGEPALSGMFTRAEVTYAWPREDGTVGSDREPVALFTGEAVHAYLGHLPDAAIEAMLNELAAELGASVGTRAHLCRLRRPDLDPGRWRARAWGVRRAAFEQRRGSTSSPRFSPSASMAPACRYWRNGEGRRSSSVWGQFPSGSGDGGRRFERQQFRAENQKLR
jgi:hypothetical protein